MIDQQTLTHLETWLCRAHLEDERADVRTAIYSELAGDPTRIERGWSWPEIRDRADIALCRKLGIPAPDFLESPRRSSTLRY